MKFRMGSPVIIAMSTNNSMSLRRRNKKKKSRANGQVVRGNNTVVRMTQPGRFAPDKFYAVLRYSDTTISRSVTSAATMNWHYRSSAFDPDPSLGTGAIPGFVELGSIYNYCRVEKMVADIQFSNQETLALFVGAWPSTTNIGNNTLLQSDFIEWSSNVNGQSTILSKEAGNNRASLRVVADLMQLVGPNGFTDLDYSHQVANNPLVPYYINIGATTYSGNNFTFNLPVRVRIDYYCCFFQVKQLEA